MKMFKTFMVATAMFASSTQAFKLKAGGDGEGAKKIKVAVVSDSTATGFGTPKERPHAWPVLLQQKFDVLEKGKYEVCNFSEEATNSKIYFEGKDFLGKPSKYYQNALNYNADIYIMVMGLNDLIHGDDKEV
jgi:hypothetical protein